MAVVNPPWTLQNSAGHTAKLFRRALGGLLSAEGLASFNGAVDFGTPLDLQVTQRGAGVNMSVDVKRGGCYVQGDDATDQGYYFVYNDATLNVSITAAHATLNRIDIIVARVKDVAEGGAAGDTSTIEVVTGTAAASPSIPSTPASAYKLANVAVNAAVTSITNANITDQRELATTVIVGRETPEVKAYKTSVLSVPNDASTRITMGNEAYDTDSFHDNSTNPARLTVPAGLDGTYVVTAQVPFANNATGYREIQILKNASTAIAQAIIPAVAGQVTIVNATGQAALVAGDYIEVYALQTSGSALNADPYTGDEGGLFIAMARIGSR